MEQNLSKSYTFMVIASAFLCLFFPVGTIKSTAVFFLEFEEVLGATAVEASLAGSIRTGVFFFSGPLASIVCRHVGYRSTIIIGSMIISSGAIISFFIENIHIIYLTYSTMMGFGTCLINTATWGFVGQVFSKKRPLTNNIISCGSSTAAIIFPILFQYWIDIYGISSTFGLVGALCLNSLPLGLLLTFPSDEISLEIRRNIKHSITTTNFSLIKDKVFVIYIISSGCYTASMVIYGIYIVRFAQSINIDSSSAAILVSISAFVDFLIRPLAGILLSKIETKSIRCYFLATSMLLFAAVCVTTATLSFNFASILVNIVLSATSMGLAGALPITLLSELFGAQKLVTSLGLRVFVAGAFTLSTPPIIGIYVQKWLNNGTAQAFRLPFFVSAAFSLLAALLMFLVIKIHKENDDVMPSVTISKPPKTRCESSQ